MDADADKHPSTTVPKMDVVQTATECGAGAPVGSFADSVFPVQRVKMDKSSKAPMIALNTGNGLTFTTYQTASKTNSEMAGEEAMTEDKAESEACLCGSNAESSFMICCDHCAVWYHGACLEVTRSMANKIETYACPPCISRDSSLHIVYRVPKRDKTKEHREEKARKKKEYEKNRGTDDEDWHPKDMKQENGSYDGKDRCDNCTNCIRNVDCGKCVNCEAKTGPCHKRVCLQSNYWDIQKKKQHTQSRPSTSQGAAGRPKRERGRPRHAAWSTDDESTKMSAATSSQQDSPAKGKRGRKKGWRKNKPAGKQSPLNCGGTSLRAVGGDLDPSCLDRTLSLGERRKMASTTYRACTRRSDENKFEKEEPKQCLEPTCTKAARKGSKYCSDECGMRLARKRLETVLPGRVDDFYAQLPKATARSMRERAALEERIQQVSNSARNLSSCQAEIHKWIKTIQNIEPIEDGDGQGGSDADFVMHCAVCTMEFPAKMIMKHVERCFVRSEKQTCFGTPFESQVNPFNIFCDQYNKANNTYCKRIRVVCSEHYKPGAEANLKVCGFPFAWQKLQMSAVVTTFPNVEQCLAKGFCHRRKKDCQQHHNWVQNLLGLIDVELMNGVLKLDECFERKRRLLLTENTRGDVLSLMTSGRTVHEQEHTATDILPHSSNDIDITDHTDDQHSTPHMSAHPTEMTEETREDSNVTVSPTE